ncbi:MAG: SDR family oxidoreductase [Bacillaceae bacterium]|nr:SDR family oxidoreductase [Bacillaceae bacterium]
MAPSFNNQTVIITGAAGGIGRELALTYAREGARVVLADIDQKKGEELVHQIKDEDGQALFIPTDVRKPADIERLMQQSADTWGTLDILINNAGVSRWKNVYELSVDEWDDIININLRGYFLCAREAARYMRRNEKGGAIVNIASTRALMSEKDTEAYAASKGGVIALTHALAVSLAEDRIRVNAVSPGWIHVDPDEALREIDHRQHPAGRVGKPADVARACLYLTDPQNDFVTGANLVVDGGMTRKMIYEA